VIDQLSTLLLSALALGFPAAALLAFAHHAQLRTTAMQPEAVSATWALLVAALLGLVYGNDWPHPVVLAIGGLMFVSGWVGQHRFLRWSLTVMFFGSISINSPSLEGRIPIRFAVESFPDPLLLLSLVSAVGILALLFRHRPRHRPRLIGAAGPRRGAAETTPWLDMILFALLLLLATPIAASWPWARREDAAFLAAAPIGIGFGAGLGLILNGAMRLESAYRGLEPRARENFTLTVMAALGIAFLGLIGLEFRLIGPALLIGYITAAGTLVANPAIALFPPNLGIWLTPKRPAADAR
jgi:hypothetical protein